MSYSLVRKVGKESIYLFYCRYQGIRHRKQIRCLPSYIEKTHNEWLNSIYEGENVSSSPNVKQAIEKYLKFCQNHKSEEESYKTKLFLEKLKTNKRINNIKREDIENIIEQKNPHTYNRVLTVYRSFFNWCYREGFSTDPRKILHGLKKQVPERQMVLLSDYEVEQILNNCNYEYQVTFLILALFTGMRHGEILNLQWNHIYLDKKVIILPGENTKNKKSRVIPIIPILEKYLKNLKPTSDYIVNYFGKKINCFRKSWKTIAKDFSNLRIHDLRHNFATMVVSSGIPIRVAQEVMGHSSSKMTEHYSKLSDEYLEQFSSSLSHICPTLKIDILKHKKRLIKT